MSLLKKITAFLLCLAVIVFLYSFKDEYRQAKMKAILEISPHAMDDLVGISQENPLRSQKRLAAYLDYFRQVDYMFPARPDMLGLQAFCLYRLGRAEEAIDLYKKVVQMKPDFIGFYYNLAIIYFNKAEYQQSLEWFEKMEDISPENTMLYVTSLSRPYAYTMLARSNKEGLSFEVQIKELYRKAQVFKLLSQHALFETASSLTQQKALLEVF